MKRIVRALSVMALMALILITAPGAKAEQVSGFDGLEFREAAGFCTVIVDTMGGEYRYDGVLDIETLEQCPEISNIASYHIYYGEKTVMDVTLREMEIREEDPEITGGVGSVLTNGYYAVGFDIDEEYEAFLTGLTAENLQQVQEELILSVLSGTGFNMEHLDFIDTEKNEWGEGENKDLCWAASCANILHYTGWAQKAGLATPDDVFEVYIDAFSPEGGNAVYGIPWFFSGINEKQGEANWAQVDSTEEYAYGEFGGFLPEYAVSNFFTGYYMRTAPRDIEKAFAELRGGSGVSIAFGWYSSDWGRSGGHAISLWGYIQKKDASGFDKNDYYALIVSDSDSDDQYDERRDAPNELWMLTMTPVVTAQGYDSWVMQGYSSSKYALLENFYALKPYSDECVREESVPGNRFDENAVDISAYIQISNGDNETDAFTAGDSVTLRFGFENSSQFAWTVERTVEIAYTLTNQYGEIVMNSSTETTRALDAGTILSVRTTATLPAGEYTFTVTVSLKNSAATETYYSNNTLERSFVVLTEPEISLSVLQNEDAAFAFSYEPADALQAYDLYELSVAYLQDDVWTDWSTLYAGRTLPEGCAVSPMGTQIKFRLEAERGGVLSHSWESEPFLLESYGVHVLKDGGDLRALLQSDTVKDGDTIFLQGTANVNDTNSDSAPWVIDKAVTIQGGTLCSRSGGIILGADVTLDGVTLQLPNDIRNAIFANGYTLTLKNVTADENANIVHLFGGTLTGHAVVTEAGEHSTIILSGQVDLGGDVYAGNMSSDGQASTWDLPVTVLVEENTTGSVMLLCGCGAMEAPVDPDQMLNPDYQPDRPEANHRLFSVTGKVTLSLWQRVVQIVYGLTGGEENVDVIYNGTGNAGEPHLVDVNHLTVESGHLALNPWLPNSTTAITIAEEAVVDLTANSGNLSVRALDGAGTLILGEETYLNITGAVSGTTKVAIGGIYEGASTGTIDHSFAYISAPNSTEDSFLLLAPQDDPDLKLVRDENGDWTIPVTVYEVIVSTITAPETIETESGCYFINIPFTVEFASDPAFSYMDAVPMSISVNGTAAERVFYEEYGFYYYVFPEGTGLSEAIFYTDDDEIMQLLPIGDSVIPDGEYIVTVTVPGENMASGEAVTLTTVVTVGEKKEEPEVHEHTEEVIPGKDATCTEPGLTEGKKCSVCGEILAAQEEIPAPGHTEEVLPGKDATCTEPGLTEGKKCSVCGIILVEQEEIPMLTIGIPALAVGNVASTGRIKLVWSAVDGAKQYEIWRSAKKDGEYTLLTTTADLTFTDAAAAGETCYYKVRAIAGENKGEFSEIIGKTCDLARPTVTAAIDAATGKPTLTWEAVPGADKYEVYVATSKTGTYTKLGSVTGTTATHKAATAGETYYYRVKAIYAANSGANSAASVAVGKTCDLARPTITVTNNEATGKPVITWKAITGATGYELWASTSKDGTYTKLGTVTGTTATHKGATAGKTYYYKLKAIMTDNSGANSAASAAVGKTCDLARPTVTVTLNAKGKPVLSWNAIDGAVGYEISVSTSVNGTYTKLGTVTGTKATISSAESGTTYYYKVRAICKVSGGNSAYSEPQAVTVE